MVLRASSHRNPVPCPPLFTCLSTLHSKACPSQVAGLFAILPFRPLLAAVEKSTVLTVCNLGYARLHEELGSKGHSSLTSWFSSSPWQSHLYWCSNKEEQMLWNQLEFNKCVWDYLKLQERYWYIVMYPTSCQEGVSLGFLDAWCHAEWKAWIRPLSGWTSVICGGRRRRKSLHQRHLVTLPPGKVEQ